VGRRAVLVVIVLAAAVAFVTAADAKNGVRATLTSTVPRAAPAGAKIVVTFVLRDRSGHPFNAERVFVKLICPTKDASSIAFASNGGHANGRYRVVAVVPPGGLGSLRIGLRGSSDVYFPITNNPPASP